MDDPTFDFFGVTGKANNWKDEYKGMPEYEHERNIEPLVVAKFKFRTREEFDEFHAIVKKYLYNDERVFDGNQKKNDYQAWYPLPPRPKTFMYVDEEE